MLYPNLSSMPSTDAPKSSPSLLEATQAFFDRYLCYSCASYSAEQLHHESSTSAASSDDNSIIEWTHSFEDNSPRNSYMTKRENSDKVWKVERNSLKPSTSKDSVARFGRSSPTPSCGDTYTTVSEHTFNTIPTRSSSMSVSSVESMDGTRYQSTEHRQDYRMKRGWSDMNRPREDFILIRKLHETKNQHLRQLGMMEGYEC